MPERPHRLLIVLPSWIGDAVMATPALTLIRESLPGAFIGALARPGVEQILDGPLIDEFHVDRARGVMGPKLVAAKLRPRRYDAALLLTNSFSTALITRLAFIPRRVGYDRDGRGILLTHKIKLASRRTPHPAVAYYLDAATFLLAGDAPAPPADPWWENQPAVTAPMSLTLSDDDRAKADQALIDAGVDPDAPLALLNPGANNPAKRWPADRFAALADHLGGKGLRVIVSGSPAEADLIRSIADAAAAHPIPLAGAVGLGPLKSIIARARLMVTNDTGPRHIAAALNTPLIALFGPTDPRWTTIHAPAGETILTADPTLPPDQVADDHPERCSMSRIDGAAVIEAADRILESS